MAKNVPLETRMKSYEKKIRLTERLPVILRIDGRAFHTFTRGLEKPFDNRIIKMMNKVGIELCKEIQNCRMAYIQSDEISFLIKQRREAEPWFGNELQKICSVSAGLASSVATQFTIKNIPEKQPTVMFDARAFVIPPSEVVNYFIWRQRDWERNSLQMLARKYYSYKKLHNEKGPELHEMIFKAGDNWNDLPVSLRRGRACIKKIKKIHVENEHFTGDVERPKWVIDNNIPMFTKDRNYVSSLLSTSSSSSPSSLI